MIIFCFVSNSKYEYLNYHISQPKSPRFRIILLTHMYNIYLHSQALLFLKLKDEFVNPQ